jgi:hypothetical protein
MRRLVATVATHHVRAKRSFGAVDGTNSVWVIAAGQRETDGVVQPVTLVPGEGCPNL